jgi:transcription elongation factor GreA-like protein
MAPPRKPAAAPAGAFAKGERVFHEKLGVGHIEQITQIGESTMYTVDFGKQGRKAMDAAFARLKKF